jgi:two-component system sensor histidine kinase CiaH
MFEKARIKLTASYLLIIMGVSISFSLGIYFEVNQELSRIDVFQRARIQRITNGIVVPPVTLPQDVDAIAEARARIILILAAVNILILLASGVGGYFLAGQTLDPIAQMMKEQKEFVSNASHELRTPITSLKTEIEVALRDEKMTAADARNILRSNLEDINNMQKLSNYLLELHRYQDSEEKIVRKKVDLVAAVSKAIDKISVIAKNANVRIVPKFEPATVMGDEGSLIELATILMDNAIKYGKKGGKIIVRVNRVGKNSQFSVQDFGVGIAPADIPHIFDRFYRAEASRNKERIEGYGLGLAIAKSIVDQHGGEISVKSKEGKGSTFTVII